MVFRPSQQGLRVGYESGGMQQPNTAKDASYFFGRDGEPLGDTGDFLAFAQPYLRYDHLGELFRYLLEGLMANDALGPRAQCVVYASGAHDP